MPPWRYSNAITRPDRYSAAHPYLQFTYLIVQFNTSRFQGQDEFPNFDPGNPLKHEIMRKNLFLPVLLAFLLMPQASITEAASTRFSPRLHQPRDDTAGMNYQSYRITGPIRKRIVNGIDEMEIKFDGDIRIGKDDMSIQSISPGGYLNFSVKTFGNKRELLVTSDRNGRLSYEYHEGRKEVPFEPEGRRWMEDILIDVVRASGIDAERRTDRIFKSGGLNGFLDEIREIVSNSVKSLYFSVLLSGQDLTNQELETVAGSIAASISSNSQCGRLFRDYSGLFLRDNDVAVSYFNAFSRLSSNSERGRIYRSIGTKLDFSNQMLLNAYFQGIDRMSSNTEAGSVLRHTLRNQDLTPPVLEHLFISVAKLSSNTEAGRVLRSVPGIDFGNKQMTEAFFDAVNHMSSNTEKGSVLRDCIGKNMLEGPAMVGYLGACRKMSSNTEKGRVLRTIQKIDLKDPDTREAYFGVIASMSSNTEKGSVLRYALEKYSHNRQSMITLLETTSRLSSNTEKGRVLRACIPHMINEQSVLDAFFRAVDKMSSSTEKGRVLRAMISNGEIDKEVITGILQSAGKISSNTEKGAVLRAVAVKIPEGDEGLRDLYFETARTLSSDSEYRRAMDAIL